MRKIKSFLAQWSKLNAINDFSSHTNFNVLQLREGNENLGPPPPNKHNYISAGSLKYKKRGICFAVIFPFLKCEFVFLSTPLEAKRRLRTARSQHFFELTGRPEVEEERNRHK